MLVKRTSPAKIPDFWATKKFEFDSGIKKYEKLAAISLDPRIFCHERSLVL